MNKKNTLVFFGNERLATGVQTDTPTLVSLIRAGYDIVAVVSNYEPGQSRNSRQLEIAKIAKDNDIPLLLPNKLDDIAKKLQSYGAQAGVLVAYGKIVPQSIIDIFPYGIINIHPSLLPLHRGPTPIESVMLSGEQKTGVSIMLLSKAMDAGPIFIQTSVQLNGAETKTSLTQTLLAKGSSKLIDVLPNILNGSLTATPQDNPSATYDEKVSKNDGTIDWTKSAIQIEREVRAYAGWPKSRTNFGDIDTTITEVKVISNNGEPGDLFIFNKQLAVYCGEGAVVIKALVPAGKKPMLVEAFLAGYKTRLNLQ